MKYYLHDTNSFQDEKITELFILHGYEGIGLFYTILEKLAMQEKPVKTIVLKKQLSVGKRLEKVWVFLEQIELISSNNGETFNENILKFSENYQIKKEKTKERVSQWRDNQKDSESVTRYNNVRNSPKVKISKDNIQQQEKNADAVVVEVDFETAKRKINDVRTATLKATMFTEQQCMSLKIPTHALSLLINGFFDEQLALAQSKAEINYTGLRAHLKNWLPIQVRLGEESKYHPEYNPQKPIQSVYPGRSVQGSVTFVPTNYVANELT